MNQFFFPRLILVVCAVVILFSCSKSNTTPPANKPPVANAGPTQFVTLPINSTTLTGFGTDEDGTVVGYEWTQVSGPNPASIVTASSTTTTVSLLDEGTYVFQLKVTDNQGATGSDTTSVIVNKSPIDTVTFAPDNNPNEVQLTLYNGADASQLGLTDMPIETWTNGGPLDIRELFKFDLSSIPSTATIMSADLFLYSDPAPHNGNLIDANFGSDNSMLVQQVVAPWSPSTTTWTNQPNTATNNQIVIPTTNSSFLDLDINVTAMVTTMITNNTNYGFLLRLQNEIAYNCRIFCSSYHATTSKHPKLVIVYKNN